mmetsp:Transcript_27306/g.66283  ORF Transcript_27306/g.66283 Transcript_27306/m.66283 type:complete len:291 (-) Transcript_27306:462-1334(-)
MMREPPGLPSAMYGRTSPASLPSCANTIVGVIDDMGRLPPSDVSSGGSAVRLGRLPPCTPLANARPSASNGRTSKSVSSLLSKKPRPGTTTAEPKFSSMVVVSATSVPCASTIDACVVPCRSSTSAAGAWRAAKSPLPGGTPAGSGAPAATNARTYCSARAATYDALSRPAVGTSTKSASAMYTLRSAKARSCTSARRLSSSAVGPRRSDASTSAKLSMSSIMASDVPPDDGIGMPMTVWWPPPGRVRTAERYTARYCCRSVWFMSPYRPVSAFTAARTAATISSASAPR